MATLADLERQVAALNKSYRMLKAASLALAIFGLGVLLLGAAAITTLHGDVAITGNLDVGGFVNGVDVRAAEVGKGAMLPFFGTSLPKGYCWADGTTNWPNAEWVPSHLRNQPVPNMDGELIGGTNDPGSVGTLWTQGYLELATSPATSGEILFWRRGDIIPKALHTDRVDAQIESAGRLTYLTNVQFKDGNSKLTLSTTKQNPRHIRCRWIIRLK